MVSDSIIVRSKIKTVTGDFNVAADFVDALDVKVKEMVVKAVDRAKANQRRTVMAKDL